MSPSLIIGTRGSRLARAQTHLVAQALRNLYPDIPVDVRIIETKGDRVKDAPLASFGGEGVFVRELERALLAKEIDLAVHSLKDLPTALPDGLAIAAVPERADVRDALISKHDGGLDALPRSARVGTSSLRRRAQLLAYRPDLQLTDLRGNIDTRLRKLEETDLDAIVLAAAGLERLGWGNRITARIPCAICLPAVGQGALAVEIRQDEGRTFDLLRPLNHEPTVRAVTAERVFLRHMGGGCRTPIGAWARMEGTALQLDGLSAETDGAWVVRDTVAGAPEKAEALGKRLADVLLERVPESSKR